MTFRNLNKITKLIYLKQYNHRLFKNSFITFGYVMALTIFTLSLAYLVFTHPSEQRNFNLFIGTFTISTVLLSSLITTLIQNSKRNKSIENEYHDVFEFLRQLNWYLEDGYARCDFFTYRNDGTYSKEDLESTIERIKNGFDRMETRIRSMVDSNTTFPHPLKNQIYLTLDQSMKIFGSAESKKSPHLESSIVTVFIRTNQRILCDPFLHKYADEEVTKILGYCFDWLILSVEKLVINRQDSEI